MTVQQLVHTLYLRGDPSPILTRSRLLWKRLVGLLLFFAPERVDEAVEVELSPTHRVKARVKREEVHEVGEFYFRDTILNQLERYFIILRRMRRADSDAYNLYRQLGATILPERNDDSWNEEYGDKASKWFLETRPSFGMVMYGTRSSEKHFDEKESKTNPTA